MLKIGKMNRLRVAKERSVGYFFDGGEHGDILMPVRHQPDELVEVDDELDVFIFHDSEGRLTATVRPPIVEVGQLAYLKVVGMHRAGAFMDWGLTKDLLVPHFQQAEEMILDEWYLVKIFLDDYGKILGSSLFDRIEDMPEANYKPGQQVDLQIVADTDLGFKAIVNKTHLGILYHNEVFQALEPGERIKGFVKTVREDNKLDLSLKKPGYQARQMDDLGARILVEIDSAGGFLEISDKSSPDEIREAFQVSKKNFKQAVGKLYKERHILIEPGGMRRAES